MRLPIMKAGVRLLAVRTIWSACITTRLLFFFVFCRISILFRLLSYFIHSWHSDYFLFNTFFVGCKVLSSGLLQVISVF
jgi:hypothetical protein